MNAPSPQQAMVEALENLTQSTATPPSTEPSAQAQATDAPPAAPAVRRDPSSFERNALALAARGIPVIPLRPMTKIAFLPNWEELATTDRKVIEEWGETYPEHNIASVAKLVLGGVWFLEIDS